MPIAAVSLLIWNSYKAKKDPTAKNELELMKENRRLREKISEYEKEAQFLKKAAAFFAREIID